MKPGDFFYFSRSERRATILLAVCIVAFLLGGHLFSLYRKKTAASVEEDAMLQQRDRMEYEDFLSSIETIEETLPERRYRQHYERREPVLSPFDPNTADSITFCRLGLPGWMARNILRYRAHGGKFRTPADFRKIYGLTDEQYNALLPYIRITPAADTMKPDGKHVPQLLVRADSDSLPRIVKYTAGTVIELNAADTVELKKIPGIGSGIARLIVGYRQRLGGFYSIEQLREISLDSEQLRPWLSIDTTLIRRIDLNRVGVEQLRNHPYINFYQAKAIVEWRKKNGPLRNLKPFVLYEEFSEEDMERIGRYAGFD